MRILYRLFSIIFIFLLPLTIVFYSLVWSVGNPDVYKEAFRSNNFYQKISSFSKNSSSLSEYKFEDGIVGFLVSSVVKDFTPNQWQDLIEGNIGTLTEWLSQEDKTLFFYIPTDNIEINLTTSLNTSVQEVVREQGDSLPECTKEELETIKQQGGFGSNQKFCLPSEVKSGQKTLSEFLEIGENQVLDKLLQNNYLNLQRNRYSLDGLNVPSEVYSFFMGPLYAIRNFLLLAKLWTINIAIITIILLSIYIILALLAKKNLYSELAVFFRSISFSILGLCAMVILSLGGTYYLNATLLSFASPIFKLGEIVDLVLWTILRISFNLISSAFWFSIFCLVLWLIFSVLSSINKKKFQARNDGIVNYQPDYNQANTFDGQFRQAVKNLDLNLQKETIVPIDNISNTPEISNSLPLNANFQQLEPNSVQLTAPIPESSEPILSGFSEEYFQEEVDQNIQYQQGVFSKTVRPANPVFLDEVKTDIPQEQAPNVENNPNQNPSNIATSNNGNINQPNYRKIQL